MVNSHSQSCSAEMLKWEPYVHSLEKEMRAQMRGVKIFLIVFSSWKCFMYPK